MSSTKGLHLNGYISLRKEILSLKTFFILWVLPFFINPVLNPSPEPKKLALIVAIGKYPEGGRWKNLSSENDLKYIKAALQKNGFAEKDMIH